MKDERARYLIIDASDITRQLYRIQRELKFNELNNEYYRESKINASEIFEKNNIPEEFQKIIVRVSGSFFSIKEAEEYTMGFPFNFKQKRIEKVGGKRKSVIVDNRPFYHDGQTFNDDIEFRTELKYSSFEDVLDLLKKMHETGCLNLYLQSIKDFFNLSRTMNDSLRKNKETQLVKK